MERRTLYARVAGSVLIVLAALLLSRCGPLQSRPGVATATPALTRAEATPTQAFATTRPPATATQPPTATATLPPTPTATHTARPAAAWTPSLTHELLARGTVQEFLQAAVERKPAATLNSYLTAGAQGASRDFIQGRLGASTPHVSRYEFTETTLLPDQSGYAVKARLVETTADGATAGTLEATFTLVREGFTWRIARIEPGAYQSARTAVTPKAPALASSTQSQLPGRLLVQESPGGAIYAVTADGSSWQRLTTGMDPVWSPDGQEVAFVRWEEPRGLYVIGADGRGERLLYGAPQVRTPAWSPDGQWIAFAIQKGGRPAQHTCLPFTTLCFDIPGDSYWRLAMVRADTGEFQDLPSDLHGLAPSWSPDGRFLVYSGDGGLQRLNVAAGTQELVVSGAGLAGPVWSSDGQWLVYQARRHDHWDLFARPAWGGEAVALTEPSALAGKAPDNLSPTFSPDGQWVAFASNRGGAWNLYAMRRDGSELRPLFTGGLPAGLSLSYDGNTQRVLAWGK